MGLKDANALGAGLGIVGEHDAQFDGKARVARIALPEGAHGRNGRVLAGRRGIESLVVGKRYVSIGRAIAI